jgi:hypothetical protein
LKAINGSSINGERVGRGGDGRVEAPLRQGDERLRGVARGGSDAGSGPGGGGSERGRVATATWRPGREEGDARGSLANGARATGRGEVPPGGGGWGGRGGARHGYWAPSGPLGLGLKFPFFYFFSNY